MAKNRFAEARISKDLTQENMAKKLNVAKNTISQWENGKREPDFDTLINLAKFYNCSIDYLLGNDIEQTKSATIKPVISFQSEAHQECVELINQLTKAQVLKLSGYIEKMLEDDSSKNRELKREK